MNGKQKWAINKLHRIAKTSAAPVIYFQFADFSSSEAVEIDLGILPYIPDYERDALGDTKKREKKRLLNGLKELQDFGVVKKLHSHNWRVHTAIITPLDNLTEKLKGKEK